MIVVLKSQISGSRDGADWPAPGSSVDLPDDEARALVASGQAEAASDGPSKTAAPKQANTSRK